MRKYSLALFVILLASSFIINEIVLASKQVSEPIRGIYVNAPNTNKPLFNQLLSLVNTSDLNAMVIDIKDDNGNLTFIPSKKSPYYSIGRPYIPNPSLLMKTLKSNNIYPIARVVVFKDNVLANKKPNLSYKTPDGLWKNARGDSFTNPFLKEVWDYNIGLAIEAVKLGFKEIQFDYVRFPEKFEKVEKQLIYDKSTFQGNRVTAVSEFVKYAKEKLKPFHVKVSVDVFGNAAVIPEAAGIGQNFTTIAQNVDVISAMIYPSHWTEIFGIRKPDLHPYDLVEGYAKVENSRLKQIHNRPISRPWIQDFTASWLGVGNYKVYGKKEVEDQIRALHAEGINEYLLWNASNKYTPNVDYTPY
ncbi:putative glycoside hydrolase [Neobacillus niacini]|uniref:putative glycoside hydrolase n=1 Tax=Neobacillus niacini TaxID=86668 RepID=UPI003983649D